jgi:hypothetical protein
LSTPEPTRSAAASSSRTDSRAWRREPYVVQQELFCTLDDGKIAVADLLCSGFLQRTPAG